MEDYKDLGFVKEDTAETIDEKLKEKLGITLADIKVPLSNYLKDKAEELTHQFPNIVPYGDYDKMLEDNDSMADFLRNEASKPENWKISWIEPVKGKLNLIQFGFECTAIDDGETFKGHVFIGMNGSIKHAFAQYDSL